MKWTSLRLKKKSLKSAVLLKLSNEVEWVHAVVQTKWILFVSSIAAYSRLRASPYCCFPICSTYVRDALSKQWTPKLIFDRENIFPENGCGFVACSSLLFYLPVVIRLHCGFNCSHFRRMNRIYFIEIKVHNDTSILRARVWTGILVRGTGRDVFSPSYNRPLSCVLFLRPIVKQTLCQLLELCELLLSSLHHHHQRMSFGPDRQPVLVIFLGQKKLRVPPVGLTLISCALRLSRWKNLIESPTRSTTLFRLSVIRRQKLMQSTFKEVHCLEISIWKLQRLKNGKLKKTIWETTFLSRIMQRASHNCF